MTSEQVVAVLEAARWAATWGHRQPVRFLVGLRGDQTFAAVSELLKRSSNAMRGAATGCRWKKWRSSDGGGDAPVSQEQAFANSSKFSEIRAFSAIIS